ncbi:Carnitine O-acetyltransferase [Anthophora quadrimaculata]
MYKYVRNVSINVHTAAITKLQLNKQPLPKQPIPNLKNTAERYLRSLKPLLNENEYNTTQKLVFEFIKDESIGSKLHKKLLKKSETCDNWMSDWWLDTAYLGYRAPVIVNSSPGTIGPQMDFKCPNDLHVFAAQLIRAVFDYNDFIKSDNIKQEMSGDVPLDMQPYGMILGTHRRPNKGSDQLVHTEETNHIIIISNNHFFKLCIVDELGVVSENKLANSIEDIIKSSSVEAKPVGILTGNDRDTWVEDHNSLIKLGNNRNIIKDIESSLFILCLDKSLPKAAYKEKNITSVRAVQCLTGFNSYTNSGNRWHDKTVQFIISPDGFVGIEYEHSPCEAIPIAVLFDHVLKYIDFKRNNTKCNNIDFPRAERLNFEINSVLEQAIKKASHTIDKLSEDLDMECFTFNEFGTNEIKSIKLSPDSFIQIAMQVTFYKLHGKPPVHYETATLRRFRNARTECIRSTSTESIDFAIVMVSNNFSISKEKKKELMIRAIQTHKQIANKAIMGEGVDRHLYGLKMMAKCDGIELPQLYKDIGYTKSTHFTLTSSQVPYKSASFMCYGPVVPEGYGCCYNPRPTDILIACSSFKSCADTSSKKFANILEEVLHNMIKLGSI